MERSGEREAEMWEESEDRRGDESKLACSFFYERFSLFFKLFLAFSDDSILSFFISGSCIMTYSPTDLRGRKIINQKLSLEREHYETKDWLKWEKKFMQTNAENHNS